MGSDDTHCTKHESPAGASPPNSNLSNRYKGAFLYIASCCVVRTAVKAKLQGAAWLFLFYGWVLPFGSVCRVMKKDAPGGASLHLFRKLCQFAGIRQLDGATGQAHHVFVLEVPEHPGDHLPGGAHMGCDLFVGDL